MSLKDDPIVLEFKAVCEQKRDEIAEYLADGKAGDMKMYNKLVGKRRGVEMAIEIIDDVIERRMTQDEVDDED